MKRRVALQHRALHRRTKGALQKRPEPRLHRFPVILEKRVTQARIPVKLRAVHNRTPQLQQTLQQNWWNTQLLTLIIEAVLGLQINSKRVDALKDLFFHNIFTQCTVARIY